MTSAKAPSLSVVSFNVNFGFASQLSAEVISELGADADCVLLTETTPAWAKLVSSHATLSQRFPVQRWHHVQGGAGGQGILSRWPLEDVRFIDPLAGW